MLGKHAVMEQVLAEGVKYVFGNPGSTEVAFMDALQDYPQLKYVLALHETSAVAMADGYARASGKPGVVNVHIAPGLANALSMIFNSWRGNSPLVITAGQQDSRMVLQEPSLAADLVRLVEPWTKMAVEVHRPDDIPMALRRAFKVSADAPRGTSVVVFPQDLLDHEVTAPVQQASYTDWYARPSAGSVDRAASLLADASRPVILIGDNLAPGGGYKAVAALAELLGAPVLSTSFREWSFPTGHPHYLGGAGGIFGTGGALKEYDAILTLGAGGMFTSLWYEPDLPFSPDATFIQVDIDPWQLSKNFPVTVSVLAEPGAAARDLLEAVEKRLTPAARAEAQRRGAQIAERKQQARQRALDRREKEWDNDPISAWRLMGELKELVPPDTVFAGGGGQSGRPAFQGLFELDEPNSFFEGGSALGFGIPGTIGVALARPDRPVVGIIRDGDAMYSIQALWTAAHLNLPITYVCVNNQEYRILKLGMVHYLGETGRKSDFIGLDLKDPPLDFAKQAAGYGVHSARVERPDDLRPALQAALKHDGPSLVDVVVDNSNPGYW